jgi:hypothetical protein
MQNYNFSTGFVTKPLLKLSFNVIQNGSLGCKKYKYDYLKWINVLKVSLSFHINIQQYEIQQNDTQRDNMKQTDT